MPWLIWLTSFLALGLWLRFARPTDLFPWDDLTMWLTGVAMVSSVLIWVQWMAGAVFTAQIVQEDALTQTSEFWKTRPIAGWRLLASKLLTVTLLLLVAPVIVLMPIWLGSGFSGSEMLEAAWDCMKWQAFAVLIAFVVATVTANVATALFTAVVAAMAVGVALLPGDAFLLPRTRTPTASATWYGVIALILAASGTAVVLRATYLWGNVRLGRAALITTLGLLVFGRCWLPWNPRPSAVPAIALTAPEQDLGECPLQADAVFQAGAARTRILHVAGFNQPMKLLVWVDERDAWRSWRDGSPGNRVWAIGGGHDDLSALIAEKTNAPWRAVEDRYLVVLANRGISAPLAQSHTAIFSRYSMFRRLALLSFELPAVDTQGRPITMSEWKTAGRLRKVRAERADAPP